MSRLVSTVQGIGRLDGDGEGKVVLLDLPHPDLGAALAAGLSVADVAAAGVRERRPPGGVDLLAPVPRPSKVWAVGFGYHDHRAEVGFTGQVNEPVIFMKAPSAVIGSGQPIRLPRVAPDEVDYEGELGVVVGTRLTDVSEDSAHAGIAGYTICNDVSARDVQKGRIPGRQADVSTAKSFDTFLPMGPCLTTLDEFDDPNDIGLRTWVDGELRQDARTSGLIHPVAQIVAYLSRQTTLLPGDVILTGTPAGVGHKRGLFLRPGSEVRIAIEDIGELVNTVAGAPPPSGR
jgi:2-keto-4-pentenoate hydratase/2-oxohepta-3-ene-1,7-dioic acid hydratase in catechol pathway